MTVGVVTWTQTDAEWLTARRQGIAASDIAPILGLSKYRAAWTVWADKTGTTTPKPITSPQIEMGNNLEPYLLTRAPHLIGQQVTRTPYRTYAHATHPWMLASPDGVTESGDLVEIKTGGLVGGGAHHIAREWDDNTIPIQYEVQVRWQMAVMDAPRTHIVALIGGHGEIVRTIERDRDAEEKIINAITTWRDRYILGGDEPPADRRDAAALDETYAWGRKSDGDEIVADTELQETIQEYRDAQKQEKAAKKRLADLRARITAATKTSAAVRDQNGNLLIHWHPRRGTPSWKNVAAALAERLDLTDTEVTALADDHRGDDTWTLK